MSKEELEKVDWKTTTAIADAMGIPPNMVYGMVEQGQLEPIFKDD